MSHCGTDTSINETSWKSSQHHPLQQSPLQSHQRFVQKLTQGSPFTLTTHPSSVPPSTLCPSAPSIPTNFPSGNRITIRRFRSRLGSLSPTKWKINSQLCPGMGRKPKRPAHYLQGRSSISTGSKISQKSNSSKFHPAQ